jgi:hypothetical protein
MSVLRNDLYNQVIEKFRAVGAGNEAVKLFNIRNESDQKNNIWNDFLGLCIDGNVYISIGTTDPGTNAMLRHPEGVAHMCLGWHKNIWVIDTHARSISAFAHEALCSRPERGCKPIKYYRDRDKNFIYSTGDDIREDFVGINMHRASKIKDVPEIGDYSDSCQVRVHCMDHEEMMELIKKVPEVAATKFIGKDRKEYYSYLFSLLLSLKSEWVNV